MTKPTEVRRHYDQAVSIALEIVEKRARAILLAHKGSLREFTMSMGMWCFTDLRGDIVEPVYINNSSLARFIMEWDEYLKLTGSPMRFAATGPKITNW